MLKPITKEEKLDMTLRIQATKAVDEILWELLDEKYHGYVDIWPLISKEKKEMVLEIKFKKINNGSEPLINERAIRYFINPGHGVKVIKK